MKISHGSTRIVLIIDKFNIAIKIPKFFFKNIIRDLFFEASYLKDSKWPFLKAIINDLRDDSRYYGSIRFRLGRGIIDNLSEKKFWKKYKHSFCVPTWFSLFGLINIQRQGTPLSITIQEVNQFYRKMIEMSDFRIKSSAHTWANPNNFCRHKGKLQIQDYACPNAQEVIIYVGKKIHNEFTL